MHTSQKSLTDWNVSKISTGGSRHWMSLGHTAPMSVRLSDDESFSRRPNLDATTSNEHAAMPVALPLAPKY